MSLRAMLAVFDYSETTLATRLVALSLADHAHDDGTNAFPSVATLAARARVDERTVQRALRELEQAGEIVQTGTTRHGVRIWRITLVGGGESSAGGDISSAEGRQIVTRTSKEPSGRKSGDKLSPLQRANRWSDANAAIAERAAAADIFVAVLDVPEDQLEQALEYHDQRRKTCAPEQRSQSAAA